LRGRRPRNYDPHWASRSFRHHRGWDLRPISVEKHWHPTQMQRLARLNGCFLDWRTIHIRSIGRSQIPHDDPLVIDDDLAVRTRNRRLVNLEVVRKTSPDGIGARPKLDLSLRRRAWINYQSRHNGFYNILLPNARSACR